ncbi:carbonic anhydrase [Bacillus sp. JJ1764]|uniref:carbonic anhydrase n=1 Tax=Bacillus sp. JJ1764 TaxID=3122964 RepID=UPI002FFDC411
MNMDEKKKVLFVIGMDQNPERIIKKFTSHQSNSITLPYYGPTILPFGELMRDIIIAVYQENVEEIFVTLSKDNRKKDREIYHKLAEHEGFQEKLQTLDYLFHHCMPEFPNVSIQEWLEGNTTSPNKMDTIVNVIRKHPLMPENVKVTEIILENEHPSEITSLTS